MSDNNQSFWTQHSGNLLIALIGAVGAIIAAVIPNLWNQAAPPVTQTRTAQNAGADGSTPEASAPSLVGTWDVSSSDGPTVVVTFGSDGKFRAGDQIGTWNQKRRTFTQEVTKGGRTVFWDGEINLKGDEFTARNQSGRQVTGHKRR
jgi:hypothetical protein